MAKKKAKGALDLLAGADSAAYPTYIADIAQSIQPRYDFVQQHFSGKTGQTYQLRNRSDKQLYCLKTIRETVSDPDQRKRVTDTLKKEVQILEPLSHRCLPKIFEHGLNGKLPFYICTFHSGQTWERFREVGATLKVEESLFVIASLIDAIEYLHSKGRTHCDLHEQNILIGERVFAENILIIDYGSGHRESASGDLTRDRGNIGFKDPWNIPNFRDPVVRELAGGDFQGNDFRALGRLLLLMEKPFFGRANSDQRTTYRDFAAGLLQGKIENWARVHENFEHVVNPNVLISRADRVLLRSDGSRSYIPMPATAQVPVGDAVLEVVNSQCFQKLRGIKQLSFCEWFFPGGTHTRFEHSLGVFGVAYSALQHLVRDKSFRENYNQVNVDGALLAALVHDVGHYPFAHVVEHYVAARYPDNEQLRKKIHHFEHSLFLIQNDTELSGAIREYWGEDIALEAIRNLTGHSGILSEILNGPVDCDKLDYLRRDAHHCGVPYGQGLNVERILSSFRCSETTRKLVVSEDGVSAIEGMVLAQDQMLGSVYWHETTRALFAMFHRFLDIVLGTKPENLVGLVERLKQCGSEYEAMNKVFVPLLDEAQGARKQNMSSLIGLHQRHNFKDIYPCVVKYGPLDEVPPRGKAVENIYSKIVKQNLTNLSYNVTSNKPIDWEQVRHLRSCFIGALKQKNIVASPYEVLIDVPWGKGSNRVVKVLREDGQEVSITDVSHLNETIFTLPAAHIAPVRVYFSPAIFRRATPFVGSIIAAARELFDTTIPGKDPTTDT